MVGPMEIAVVGSGYVGLVAGACFAELGHNVTLVDNDQQKLAALRRGECPIHEKFLPELLERHRAAKLTFTAHLHSAVRPSQTIFLPFPPPPNHHHNPALSLSPP